MSYPSRAYEGSSREQAGPSAWVVGFVVLAAIWMTVAGAFHFIQGLAAVIDDDYFVIVNTYAYDRDVSTWGWLHLFGGIILVIGGLSLLSGATWARILAVFLVIASALLNFVSIPYYPLWSIVLLALDGLIIWALLSYDESHERSMTVK
jgi:hypothetical protein